MSLGSETVSLLRRAIDILNHQMSPNQHALLSADDRRSMLQQLTVATEAAGRLADVVHMEAAAVAQQITSGSDTERIRAETERLKAEAEKIKAETERTRAEGEKVGMETQRTAAEGERTKVEVEKVGKELERAAQETEKMKAEALKVGKEVERAMAETERSKAEAEKVGEQVERTVAHTENTKVQVEKVAKEVERAAKEMQSTKAEVVKAREEVERLMAEMERTKGEVEELRSETGHQTAIVPPASVSRPPETPSVSPSTTTLPQNIPAPATTRPPVTETVITDFYDSSHKVMEIKDAVRAWNRSNTRRCTLAAWAWFRHSETEAFLVLNNRAVGYTAWSDEGNGRIGTIKLPKSIFQELSQRAGYGGAISVYRREDRSWETVIFQ
ncbi:hypothetical protein DFP73DRAFT_285572 [Morchella snyderi]|nr:hypothetical protein DFP73DRAFT_285572 [Morchella snyderi]